MARMKRVIQIAAIAAFFAAGAASAVPIESETVKTDNARVVLAPAMDGVTPGGRLTLALRIEHAPGWHTYWTNPGDSGAPTTVEWTMPDGVEIGPLAFPAPHRVPTGPLINFGFEDELVILATLQAPAGIRVGETFRVEAEAQWLVCKDICIPEDGRFALDIPVVDPAAANGVWAARIAEAQDALPRDVDWSARYAIASDAFRLTIDAPELQIAGAVEFFPDSDGLIENAAAQVVRKIDGGIAIETAPGYGASDADLPETITGVLAIDDDLGSQTARRGFRIEAALDTDVGASGIFGAPGARAGPGAAIQAVLFAFLGGLILNLMPCVFPVLSMKAMSLIHARGDARTTARAHGLWFTGGALAAFGALGVALIALRAGGQEIGWGFQLQSPMVVALLAYVMLAVGLNLSGVFELGTSLQGVGQDLATKGGGAGAFFTGALAAVVAAPCTAPFMGPATGFALSQSAPIALLVFLAMGFGLAFPFLLISLEPRLGGFLPRPGAWMKTFREVLAFPMYAAGAWLLWVLSTQTGPGGLAAGLSGALVVGFAIWLYGRAQASREPLLGRVGYAAAGVSALFAVAVTVAGVPPGATAEGGGSALQPKGFDTASFSEDALADLRAEGRAVFVDFTAAWCVTCLANKRVALERDAVRDAFEVRDIVFMTADWTNRDPVITRALSEFGRAGVPLYVYYPAEGGAARILPQILTVDIVLDAIAQTDANISQGA